MRLINLVLISLGLVNCQTTNDSKNSTTKTCDSPIYCDGPILAAVQKMKIFPDGKTFVDMPTSKPLQDVLDNFNKLGSGFTKEQLKKFVDDNFHPAGYELEEVILEEFNPDPKFLKKIDDPILRGFTKKVNSYWSKLIRKTNLSKLCPGCVSSYLPTKHQFVVPGGRFREFYYWDTYFALQGMLLSELHDTSKAVIENLLDFVDIYGFVPNGARIYFLNRSQPPLLAPMVSSYLEKNNDQELLKRALLTLDLEYQYWIDHHQATVPCNKDLGECQLMRYYVENKLPRPESYLEDFTTVEEAKGLNQTEKEDLYANLATGAESGWDYSSRWLKGGAGKGNEKNEEILRRLNTRNIIPVDLNSIMYMNERTLAQLHRKYAKSATPGKCNTELSKEHLKIAKEYDDLGDRRAKIMQDVLFDAKTHSFYDFNLTSSEKTYQFSASNYWPYWADAFTPDFKKDSENFIKGFDKIKELSELYPGGIPATIIDSSLQWDLPNTWPPLEYALVKGLTKSSKHLSSLNLPSESLKLSQLSTKVANTFLKSTFCAWYRTGGDIPGLLLKFPGAEPDKVGQIFEKFNVTRVGVSGGGGEYTVQDGFGWTNGVLLSFIDQYAHQFTAPDPSRDCDLS